MKKGSRERKPYHFPLDSLILEVIRRRPRKGWGKREVIGTQRLLNPTLIWICREGVTEGGRKRQGRVKEWRQRGKSP